jgi:hypothetical protein
MATKGEVLSQAVSALGTPYVWGGASRAGFDCSGLVQWIADTLGVPCPRTSEEQWAALAPTENPQPGDLVFFDVAGDDQAPPQHVGIVVGPDQMIDAPHTGAVVRYDGIQGWAVVMGYRQLVTDGAPAPQPAPAPAPAPGPTGGSVHVDVPELSEGSEGGPVKALQVLLNLHQANLAVDGSFGPATAQAVRNYQTVMGGTVDGVVGPQTWGALIDFA